jgi:hypothetical protein
VRLLQWAGRRRLGLLCVGIWRKLTAQNRVPKTRETLPEMSICTLVAVLLAIGAFAGVLAGTAGVGGGIVLVPAFFFTFFSALGYDDGPQLMQLCLGITGHVRFHIAGR